MNICANSGLSLAGIKSPNLTKRKRTAKIKEKKQYSKEYRDKIEIIISIRKNIQRLEMQPAAKEIRRLEMQPDSLSHQAALKIKR